MKRVGSLTGHASRGSSKKFRVNMLPNDILVGTPAVSASVTLGYAAEMHRFDTAELEKTFKAVATAPGVTLVSNDETKAVVNSDGVLERVGAGGVVRVIGVNSAGVRSIGPPVSVYHAPTAVTYEFTGWAAGSLARYYDDKMLAALPDPADPASLPMFSSFQYNQTGVRNPLNWAALDGWDLSCISVDRPNCCLIGSDIILQAEHYPDHGTTAFVGMDGSVHKRDIVSSIHMGPIWDPFHVRGPDGDGHQSDFRILKLDSPLPASVKPVLMPPLDGESYLVDITTVKAYGPKVPGVGIPNLFPKANIAVMHSNQEKRTQVFELFDISRAVDANVNNFRHPRQASDLKQTARDAFLLQYAKWPRRGDSGSNQFFPPLPGDDRMTVIGCFTGTHAGTNIFMFLEEMTAAAATLGCVGELEHADWSAYSRPT